MHKKTIHKHFLNNHVKRVHQQIKWFHCKLGDLGVLRFFFCYFSDMKYVSSVSVSMPFLSLWSKQWAGVDGTSFYDPCRIHLSSKLAIVRYQLKPTI